MLFSKPLFLWNQDIFVSYIEHESTITKKKTACHSNELPKELTHNRV